MSERNILVLVELAGNEPDDSALELASEARRLSGGGTVAAALAGMILLVQSTPNWNHGTAGMIRYAVWMTPLCCNAFRRWPSCRRN